LIANFADAELTRHPNYNSIQKHNLTLARNYKYKIEIQHYNLQAALVYCLKA
jgi:hypothetical protein